MKTKHILIAFAITAIAQLAIPLKMVYDSEITATEGTEYKFRTQPIDPSDPFRGKYITLNYDVSSFDSKDTTWVQGETVYAEVITDSAGFAKLSSLSRNIPKESDYFKTVVRYQIHETVTLEIPFDRYYMEESKAYEAEVAYRKYSQDNVKPAYAVVALKDGNAVVKDVIIDGKPVREYVLKARKKPANRKVQ